jgi:hypothetical protein
MSEEHVLRLQLLAANAEIKMLREQIEDKTKLYEAREIWQHEQDSQAIAERDADNARLRAALEAVEFVSHPAHIGRWCPWCHILAAHTPDCQRQAALGIAP